MEENWISRVAELAFIRIKTLFHKRLVLPARLELRYEELKLSGLLGVERFGDFHFLPENRPDRILAFRCGLASVLAYPPRSSETNYRKYYSASQGQRLNIQRRCMRRTS